MQCGKRPVRQVCAAGCETDRHNGRPCFGSIVGQHSTQKARGCDSKDPAFVLVFTRRALCEGKWQAQDVRVELCAGV